MEQHRNFVLAVLAWICLTGVGASAGGQSSIGSCFSRLQDCRPQFAGSLKEVVKDGALSFPCHWNEQTEQLKSEVCVEDVRRECTFPPSRFQHVYRDFVIKGFVCRHSREFIAGAQCWTVPGLQERLDNCNICGFGQCIQTILSEHRENCTVADENLLVELVELVFDTQAACREWFVRIINA